MPEHRVTVSTPPRISRGGVDWWPDRARRTEPLTCEQFAAPMEGP